MRVIIVGAGVVGTATGRGFARHGHAVTFVDVNAARIDTLRSEGFSASDQLDLSGPAATVLLSVPTPAGQAPAGYDLGYIEAAATSVGSAIRTADELPTVVVRSTVPPGTCDAIVQPILEEQSGGALGTAFALASNPEFLRAACALEDFLSPRMTVIGSRSKATQERLVQLYEGFGGEIRTFDNPATAELVKVSHNLYNAAKISYWNELWRVGCAIGVDPNDVASTVAISSEASWNPGYGIRGGAPFGGACLPKDTRGFIGFAERLGVDVPLATAVESVNHLVEAQAFDSVDLIDLRTGADAAVSATDPSTGR